MQGILLRPLRQPQGIQNHQIQQGLHQGLREQLLPFQAKRQQGDPKRLEELQDQVL